MIKPKASPPAKQPTAAPAIAPALVEPPVDRDILVSAGWDMLVLVEPLDDEKVLVAMVREPVLLAELPVGKGLFVSGPGGLLTGLVGSDIVDVDVSDAVSALL